MAVAKKLGTKNGYLSGIEKGGTHMRVKRTHEWPGVTRRPRLAVDQQYVRSECKNNENRRK